MIARSMSVFSSDEVDRAIVGKKIYGLRRYLNCVWFRNLARIVLLTLRQLSHPFDYYQHSAALSISLLMPMPQQRRTVSITLTISPLMLVAELQIETTRVETLSWVSEHRQKKMNDIIHDERFHQNMGRCHVQKGRYLLVLFYMSEGQ